MTVKELEDQLSKLNESEKKELLRRLIADLDAVQDEGAERAWLEVAQQRYRELKEGIVEPVPAEKAIAKARERLRDVR
jgi:hypothetical protein